MGDGGPDGHPRNELRVEMADPLVDADVEDGVVEQRDQAGDAHDGQGLTGEGAEHQRRQRRREEPLVDAEEAVRLPHHVQLKGQRGEEIHEEDADRPRAGAVVEPIDDITRVVWQTSTNIPVHSAKRPCDAVALPSRESFP